MQLVLITALGVGAATVLGALVGFIFKEISHRFTDIIISFAAGIMLSAAVLGLILPSVEYGGKYGIVITVVGIFFGAVCINLVDKLVPHIHKLAKTHENKNSESLNKVILFVLAIAIHNFPEGIAAGVGFGSENTSHALLIAGGIAIQNIPEGMVIISPMLASGITPKRTFLIAAATGLIEVLGTFIGYFAVSVANMLLPFALSFAGGTMLYVVSAEMIPETHSHGAERSATYALLLGFCLMLVSDYFLG